MLRERPHACSKVQPDFLVAWIGGPHAIENDEHVIVWRVSHFTCEVLHLGRLVRSCSVAARVVVDARPVVSDFHPSCVPEVACALEIFPTADSIPVTRRIHALASVIGRRPQILGPEEFFAGLVNQHRIVSNSATIVVQVMRTLCVSVVGPTLGSEISLVVNEEMILIKVIVLGEVWTRVEFNPG